MERLGDGQSRGVEPETRSRLGLHAGEAENLGRGRLATGDGVTQRLGLKPDPLLDRNLGPVNGRVRKPDVGTVEE